MLLACLNIALIAASPDPNAAFPDVPSFTDHATHTADELANILIRKREAFTAVSLVYQSLPQDVPGNPDGSYWRRSVSANEDGFFISHNCHGHDELPWQSDPNSKSLLVTPGQATLMENLNRTVAQFDPGSDVVDYSLRTEVFFEVLAWWPFDDIPAPRNDSHSRSLREMLKKQQYRLLPEIDHVRSTPCYVFAVNDVFTLWCDCEQPGRILRSEIANPKTRSIHTRIEMMDFKDFGQGIWLPTGFQIIRFDSNAHTTELRQRRLFDHTFLVSDVKVNEEVKHSEFSLTYPPGTVMERKAEAGVEYEVMEPGQSDHFRSIVNWCRIGSNQSRTESSGQWRQHILVLAISFLVGCAFTYSIHRKKRLHGCSQG